MSHFSPQTFAQLHALCSIDPRQAIAIVRQLEADGLDDPFFIDNKLALLIDAGSELRDSALIEEGVALLETQMKEQEANGEGFSPNQWFNMGNGHYAAENARRGRKGYVYAPTETPMTRAKECYRAALAAMARFDSGSVDEEEPSLRLQTELLINYGNSLNELGRTLEAIDLYEEALELDAQHPMAWARLGDTLWGFAQFARDPQLVRDAVNAYGEALADDRLERYGYGHVRPFTSRQQAKAEKQLANFGTHFHEHLKPQVLLPYHQEFVSFCSERRLFLNFSLRRTPSPHPYEDKFRFSVTTPVDDSERFPRLVHALNELTERFAIARLLLFEAHQSPYDTTFYDTITRYIDLNDASIYGVRAAKLKLAFESAYNILDKIALFLNDYLKLGLDKRNVYFTTIWDEKSKFPATKLRPQLLDGQNNFVFALYDLACDFGKNARGEEGEWAHFKSTRHLLMHQYLVLHAFDWDWQIVDGAQYHRQWDEMMVLTESLLYVTRNALIYLILAVELEEARTATAARQGRDKEKILERPFNLHPPGSGLT